MGCCASKKNPHVQNHQSPKIIVHHTPETNVKPSSPVQKPIKAPPLHPLKEGELGEAARLLAQDNYVEAIEIYQRWIENSAGRVEAIDGVGQIELSLGDYEWFPLTWYREGVQSGTFIGTAYDVLSLCYGRLLANQSAVAKGTQWYSDMVDAYPQDLGLIMGYANILCNQSRYDQAISYYQRVGEMKPRWGRPLECLALIYQYQKVDKNKAVQVAERLSSLEAGNKIALFVLARHQETAEQKIAKLKELTVYHPKFARAINEIGIVYGGEYQDYGQAIRWYQQAIEVAPDYYSCYNNIGVNFELLKNYDEALEWYFRGIEKNREYKSPHKSISYVFDKKKYGEQEVVNEMRKYRLAEDYFYYYLGVAYYERKKYQLSIKYYMKAYECAKELARSIHKIHNSTGITYEDMKQFENAKKYYLKSIESNKQFYPAYYNMAVVHQRQGQLQESIYWFQQAIECEPYSSAAYDSLGNIYQSQCFYQQAIKYYKKAVECCPSLSLALANMSICYFKLDQYSKAFTFVQRAKESLPMDRHRLSEENKRHLIEVLDHFDRQGNTWRMYGCQTDQKDKIQRLIQSFELKFSQFDENGRSKGIVTEKVLKKEVLQIIRMLHEDGMQLTTIGNIFQEVQQLTADNQEYFHIIPRLLVHYYYQNSFQQNKPYALVEKPVREMVKFLTAKANDEGRRRYGKRNSVYLPALAHFDVSKSSSSNLFRNKSFSNYSQLYKELMVVVQAAQSSWQAFKDLVDEVSRQSFGVLQGIDVKVPKHPDYQSRAILQIFSRIFHNDLSKERLEMLAKTIDEAVREQLKDNQNVSLIETSQVVYAVMEAWVNQINEVLNYRKRNSIETICQLTDLIQATIRFNSLDHLKKGIQALDATCYLKNYNILAMQDRLNLSQFQDVLLNIQVDETVCQLRLSLRKDDSEVYIIESLSQIERSPVGCIFGSLIFMQAGVQYPFAENCKQVVKELSRAESTYEKRTLEAAEYVVKCFNKFPSV